MNVPCNCCSSVIQYISEHLDRAGLVTSEDDPEETFATFQACFPNEDLGITIEDVAEYIESLPVKLSS